MAMANYKSYSYSYRPNELSFILHAWLSMQAWEEANYVLSRKKVSCLQEKVRESVSKRTMVLCFGGVEGVWNSFLDVYRIRAY